MQRFPVLMYHSLRDGLYADTQPDKYSVTQAQFSSNMEFLWKHGYVVESCAGMADRLVQGAALPDKYCVVTIDDGHRSGLEAARILSEGGGSASFFITKYYCENSAEFFSENDIANLVAMGMEIGGHGVSHRSLAHMHQSELLAELKESFNWLESVSGRKPLSMSLPAGQGGSAVEQAVFAAGYRVLGNSADRLAAASGLPVVLNRYVVLNGFFDREIRMLVSGSGLYAAKRILRSLLLSIPKRILRAFDRQRTAEGR